MLQGSILKQVVATQGEADSTPINFGVYYKNTLVALCHALEDFILGLPGEGLKPLVITAFQRGKWYLQEADRYAAIANQAEQIVIMASPEAGFHSHPTSQRPNVALVDLADDDPVNQEWHLIILSPDYSAMVLCQELSDADYGPAAPPTVDLERKFYGLWSFDRPLVIQAAALAIAHLGRYQPDLQAHLQTLWQQQQQQNNHREVTPAVTQVVRYLQQQRDQLLDDPSLSHPQDLDQNLASNELQAFLRMAQWVDRSDPLNPLAAREVVEVLEIMGQLLDLPAWQVQRLRLAGWLHRIAPASPAVDSRAAGPACPLVPAVQSLRLMPRLRAVATIIAHQGEWWNGQGSPAGLAGEAIPLESRLLGLAAEFQRCRARAETPPTEASRGLVQGLEACQAEAGSRWDPTLVELLGLTASALQQGLGPPITQPTSLVANLLNPDLSLSP
jgi:DICT domain-containing protein